MAKQSPAESVQMSRAARHLIETHGPRAAAIWRSIAAIVREIEAEAARAPAGTTKPD
jgi:hypothetical protein